MESQVIWEIRLPRVLSAVLLGGALSLSGFLLQDVYKRQERFGSRHEFPHLPHPLLQHERYNHRCTEDSGDGADGKLDGGKQDVYKRQN